MNKLIGQVTFNKGKPKYDGLVTQILGLGGFEVKVMVQYGYKDSAITELLGGAVLGIMWEPQYDRLVFKLKIKLHDKNKPGQLDDTPDLTVNTLHLLKDVDLNHRMVLSAVNRIYDTHGLLTPVTSRFKILVREIV